MENIKEALAENHRHRTSDGRLCKNPSSKIAKQECPTSFCGKYKKIEPALVYAIADSLIFLSFLKFLWDPISL